MFTEISNVLRGGAALRTADGHTPSEHPGQTHAETERSAADDSEGAEQAGEATGDEWGAIGLDEIFGLLKNRRRRGVFRYLARESGPVSIGELAEWIAARECGKDVAHVDSAERKRVYVALHQCHLSKMAGASAVTYDRREGTVERGPNFALFRHYLPEEEETIDPSETRDDWIRRLVGFLT